MSRLQRAAVLLTLLVALKCRGSWCGETHLQKAAYFLQTLCQVPLGYSFVLYRHGPYSFDLSDEITALQADMLLDVHPREPYGPSLAPSENSQRFLANFQQTQARYLPSVNYVADHIGDCRVVELERLATALFVTQKLNAASVRDRAARLRELKPHIQVEAAERAVADVDGMLREVAISMPQ